MSPMALHLRSFVPVGAQKKAHPWNIQLSHRCAKITLCCRFSNGPAPRPCPGIACSVCTVDLAFMLNVMQCKEILYIICKIAIIVNQNIIEDVRRIKMKTKIRSPSLCKDCLDYSWHVVIMSRSSSARSWVCSFRFSLCS